MVEFAHISISCSMLFTYLANAMCCEDPNTGQVRFANVQFLNVHSNSGQKNIQNSDNHLRTRLVFEWSALACDKYHSKSELIKVESVTIEVSKHNNVLETKCITSSGKSLFSLSFFLLQLMTSEESFIRSEYTRLQENEQILQSRLLSRMKETTIKTNGKKGHLTQDNDN